MSLIRSVLFGDEGYYNIWGVPVIFKKRPQPVFGRMDFQGSIEGDSVISKIATQCINSHLFIWMTQGYLHLLTHEMSHALAYKFFLRENGEVQIIQDPCIGLHLFSPQVIQRAADWEKTMIDIAGSMGNVAFSLGKLALAIALKDRLPQPVSIALGGGAMMWIAGELFYSYLSVVEPQRDGDFSLIAKRNKMHLLLASAALITETSLGIFAAAKLYTNLSK